MSSCHSQIQYDGIDDTDTENHTDDVAQEIEVSDQCDKDNEDDINWPASEFYVGKIFLLDSHQIQLPCVKLAKLLLKPS